VLPARQRRRAAWQQQQQLRSRNRYIDRHLADQDGTDAFADLENFIVDE
jgi:hypothetical protein